MDKYTLGENGLVIAFAAMFENGDFKEVESIPTFVNLGTLVRNVLNAFDFKTGNEAELLSTLPEQIDSTVIMLSGTFSNLYGIPIKVYHCGYQHVKYNALGLPIKETAKRKLTNKWIKAGVDSYLESHQDTIYQLDNSIEGPDEVLPDSCCLITHYAEDLLYHHRFDNVRLLESHTGDIRGKSDFNRKIQLNKEQRPIIPFNRFTQHVFGDGTLYGPMDLDIRRNIVEIAEKSGWTKATPLNRINHLMQRHNKALATAMRDLLT